MKRTPESIEATIYNNKWRELKLRGNSSPDFKWFVVVTRQDATNWGDALSSELERYALVVTVADRENEEAQLYTQISQRIDLRAKARAKV